MSLEERIERLEEMMKIVIRKLEELEAAISGSLGERDREAMLVASRLVVSALYPASLALESARRVVEVTSRFRGLDPISRSIVESLSSCDDMSISQVTRMVRRLRGSASRRIVASRLKRLEERGVVVNVGNASRPRYVLSRCLEEYKS